MLHFYAKWIGKLKWPIVVIWVLLAVTSVLFLPNLGDIISHTSTNYLPSQSETVQGQNLLKQVNPSQYARSTGVIVLHNPKGLSAEDERYFRNLLSNIDAHHGKDGIQYVRDLYNSNKNLSATFVSQDHTTDIAFIGFPQNEVSQATATAITGLKAVFGHPPAGSHVYLTGQAPIQQDDMQISQAGVRKTAVVTISLVLLILLLIFRSVVAPFVALSSIILSYLMASGVVAFFAQHGLPVSNITQTFLIAILFGAGTDYSIIMMNRFREELLHNEVDKQTALSSTLRAISKTVVFSSSTVLVSFAVLGFAKFGLYRTAIGVSIGVAIALITCLLFLPALMSILGRFMFWPRRILPGSDHRPSGFWVTTSRFAVRRSWLTILALIVVLAPVAMLFTNQRTFNPLNDIPFAPSAVGFATVATAFGPGSVLPSQIVLKTNLNLRTPQGLTTIENMSKAMAGLAAVQEVESATRPTGALLSEFEISNQNQQAAKGLHQVQQGLAKIQRQLPAKGQSSGAGSQSQRLVTGSQQVTSGLQQLGGSFPPLSAGVTNLQKGVDQLSGGLGQTSTSMGQLSNGLDGVSSAASQLSTGSDRLVNALAAWAKLHPDTQGNPTWSQIAALSKAMQSGLRQQTTATETIAQGSKELQSGIEKLNSSAHHLNTGVSKISDGVKQLGTSTDSLAKASQKVTSGVQSLVTSVDAYGTGAALLDSSLGKLNQSVGKVNSYLLTTDAAAHTGDPGFYISSAALQNANIKHAMAAYISPDGHVAKFNIVLTSNPYSLTAINQVSSIESAADTALQGSPIHTGTVYATGTTPIQSSLNQLSSQDFVRTIIIVLGAIFLLLILMLRSIITPLYIILSLCGAYLMTVGTLQAVTLHVLHEPGISWYVPFFVFLLLVALGVDYSIFLMSRFEEELRRGLLPKQAIQTAMANMGNVIFSAALIMAGTFGSMMVAGVSSLIEIGLSVVIGLFFYVVLFLGLFVPACVSVIGDGHFWPFAKTNDPGDHSVRIPTDKSPHWPVGGQQ